MGDTGSTGSGGAGDTVTTSSGSEEGGDSSSSTGGSEPLAACLDLPEADAAGWVPGMMSAPSASASASDLEVAGTASWGLAVRMLQAAPPDNYAGSPLTMMTSLGLAYARHGEVCGGRLLETIGLPEGEDVHDILGGMLGELANRNLEAVEDGPDGPLSAVDLLLSPSSWTVGGPPSSVAGVEPYGVAQHGLTGSDNAAMNAVINCVVEQQSQGLLTDFLPSSIPASDTTAVDLTVAYLGAPWGLPLEEAGELSFMSESGSIDVPAIQAELLYGSSFEDDDVLAFSLPLRGDALSVMFVMPTAEGGVDGFVEAATEESLTTLRDSMAETVFELRMPEVDIPAETIDYYEPFGLACDPFTMRTALDGVAIQIDATGIRAAAAGAVESWASGTGSPADRTFILNQPYLFFVYDEPTGVALFHGRYVGV